MIPTPSAANVGFIGAGNMAKALAGGLLARGWAAERLHAADPHPDARAGWHAKFGLSCAEDNVAVARAADVLVLAVKPQQMATVARALAPAMQGRRAIVISIAAGIRLAQLEAWLGHGVAIVRAMPNTPALVGSGAAGLYANTQVDAAGRQLAHDILASVGVALWLETEDQLDAVTALSGSGPAYFFLMMEALERAGVELGLAPSTARALTLATALGAARMATASDDDPATLRTRVTSPGGTTEAALKLLQRAGYADLVARALKAAAERARELAEQYGKTA